jgi:hypothetical protein
MPRERQARWRRKVQAAQKQDEIDQVRGSLKVGKPLDTRAFVWAKAHALRLNLNARPRGDREDWTDIDWLPEGEQAGQAKL